MISKIEIIMQKTNDVNQKSSKPQENSKILQFIIYLLFGLGATTGNVILVLFGVLSKEFNVNPNAILISIPAFMIPFAIIQLFSGAISDVKGRFPVIIFGLILFGSGLFIAAISSSLLLYVIANILAGTGFGFVNPVLIALMTDITSPGPKIPKKMGYLGAVAALGLGLGPLLTGQMVQYSWRYTYIILFLIVGFSLLILLIIKRPVKKPQGNSGISVLFSHIYEEIHKLTVILMISASFLTSITYLAIVIWTSRTFSGVVDESITGIILSCVGIAGAISGLVIGYLIKRLGIGFTLFLGIFSLLISLILLIMLGDITRPENLTYVAVFLIIAGIAGGILFPAIMYYSQIFSPERRGALAGLITAAYFLGIALIPMIYSPFFLIGGIINVYTAILIVAIVLFFIIGFLFTLAKRQQ